MNIVALTTIFHLAIIVANATIFSCGKEACER